MPLADYWERKAIVGKSATLAAAEWELWRQMIAKRCGIALLDTRRDWLEHRLRQRMERLKVDGLSRYYHFVAYNEGGAGEWIELLELVVNNETYFRRHDASFEALANLLVPARLGVRPEGSDFSVWSAGCSRGQEAYSLAMTLLDHPLMSGVEWRVLGTDISPRQLGQAELGLFAGQELRGLPDTWRDRYFEPIDGMALLTQRVRAPLRRRVQFASMNLAAEDAREFAHLPPQDVIFCQNVLLYFSEPVRQRVAARFCAQLKPGGFLVTCPADLLSLPPPGMTREPYPEAVVFRRRDED